MYNSINILFNKGSKYMKYTRAITLLFASFLVVGCANSNGSQNIMKRENLRPIAYNAINSPFADYTLEYLNKIRLTGSNCANATTPLNYNVALEAAAMAHAKDMALNRHLEHDGSGTNVDIAKQNYGGSKFYERILYFGYPAKPNDLVGEGVTYTTYKAYKTKDIKKLYKYAVDRLMKDYEHCKIIMNPRFRDVGVGYYQAKDRVYWVLDFGETE